MQSFNNESFFNIYIYEKIMSSRVTHELLNRIDRLLKVRKIDYQLCVIMSVKVRLCFTHRLALDSYHHLLSG